MAEGPAGTGARPRARPAGPGGRVLSLVAPGLPQLLAGRAAVGAPVLAAWAGLIWLAAARWERVAAAPGGPWDHRLALAVLVAALVGCPAWSWWELGRPARRSGGGEGPWALVLRAFRRDGTAVAGAWVVAALGLGVLLVPFLAPFDPAFQGDLVRERLLAPSALHPLGTDQLARDVLSRVLYGARISLLIGVLAVAIAVGIGTLVGAVAGYLGGLADAVLMRGVDMVLAFPRIVLLVSVVALFEPGLGVIVAVLGLTLWPGTARLVRGEVLSLREREFVEAARALGYSRRRIVLRHLIPNALGPVVVAATLGIGNTIVLEAGLSFLGIGVQPPTPSWGTMVADGRDYLLQAWWLSTFPGLAVVATVLAFNLVGDGLRDALDPRAGARRWRP